MPEPQVKDWRDLLDEPEAPASVVPVKDWRDLLVEPPKPAAPPVPQKQFVLERGLRVGPPPQAALPAPFPAQGGVAAPAAVAGKIDIEKPSTGKIGVGEWAGKKDWRYNVPFLGSVLKSQDLEQVNISAKYLEGGPEAMRKYVLDERLRGILPGPTLDFAKELGEPKKGGRWAVETAQKEIDDYLTEVIEAQMRGYTLPAAALDIAMNCATFAVEFAITGKLAGKMGAGKHVVGKGAGLLKKGAIELANIGERAAGRTLINIPAIQADIQQRILEGDSQSVAGRKAYLSGFIQNFTEELGGLGGKGVGAIGKLKGWDKKTLWKVMSRVLSLGPMEKVGLQNIPGEYGEEIMADIAEATAGTSGDTIADVAKRWTDPSHWLLLTAGFGPMFGLGAAGKALQVHNAKVLANNPKWVEKQTEILNRYNDADKQAAAAKSAPITVARRYGVSEDPEGPGVVLSRRVEIRPDETTETVIKAVVDSAGETEVAPIVPSVPKGSDKAGRPERKRIRAERKIAQAKLAEYKGRQKATEPARKAAAKGAIDKLKPLKKTGGLLPEFRAAANALLDQLKTKSMTDAQERAHRRNVEKFEKDPTSVNPASYQYSVDRLAEKDNPTLRDMPEKKIKLIGALAEDVVKQNKFKQQQIDKLEALKAAEVDAAMQQLEKDLAFLRGEKYAPTVGHEMAAKGIVGKAAAVAGKAKRVGASVISHVKHWGYTHDSLVRAVARPGTLLHKIMSEDPQWADLIVAPAIRHEATDAVVAEMQRRGINVDKWQKEVVEYLLQGKVVDERGRPVKKLSYTRMELADLYNSLKDPYTYRQLREQGAQGFKLAPRSKLVVTPDAATLRAIREGLKGLPESERTAIVEFADWLRVSEYNGRLAALFQEAKYEETGEIRNLYPEYYPMTREEEFIDTKHARKGNVMMARKGGKYAINIESALTRHAGHVEFLAERVAKARANKQMEAILGDRRFVQAVRGAFVDGDYILKRLERGREIWSKSDSVPKGIFDKVMRQLTKLSHVGALGLPNIPVGIYQTFSRNLVLSSRGMEFAKYLSAGDSYNPIQIAKMNKWIKENIPWLKDRFEGSVSGIITPEVSNDFVLGRYGGKGGIPRQIVSGTHHVLLSHIKLGDRTTIDRIGLAIKLEGMDKGLSGKQLDDYVKWELVKEVVATQPSSDSLSLSGYHQYARAHPSVKPFVMFTAPLVKQYNQIAQAFQDFEYKRKTGQLTSNDFGKLGYRIAIPLILNSFLIYMVRFGYDKLVAALLGVEDDKELKDIISGTMSRTWGNLPVIGPRVDSALGFVRGQHRHDPTGNIIESSIYALGEAGYYAHKALGEKSPKKAAAYKSRMIGKAMRGGQVFAFPGGGVAPWYDKLTKPKRR